MAVKVTCVVQARTGSTRFPGKVLADIGGRPALGFMLERLNGLAVDNVVVATTDLSKDDPVEAVARSMHVSVTRGPEEDVLTRFALALDAFPADLVVRLTADCPFTDPGIVLEAVRVARESDADYVSNTLVRTFPRGLDVEVIKAGALRAAADEAEDPDEREHVTPHVYRHSERFSIRVIRSEEPLGHERWVLDTPEDLDTLRRIAKVIEDPRAGWREILERTGMSAKPSFRVATPDDLASLLEWSRAAIASPLPAFWSSDDPGEGFLRSLLDPRLRVWVMDARATVQVEADSAIGRVGVAVESAQALPAALDELIAALSSDYQFVELVAQPSEGFEDMFAEAGFRYRDGGWSLETTALR